MSDAEPKKPSKSDQIRDLLKKGDSAAAIAKQVGCTVGLVYNVKARLEGPSRPRGNGKGQQHAATNSTPPDLQGIIDAVRASQLDSQRMRSALLKIQDLVTSALSE